MMKKLLKLYICICFIFSSVYVEAQGGINLKVMTFNLRFGERASLEQIGSFIKKENPDIVMLQEVDVNTHRKRAPLQNGKNFVAELGFYTEMFTAYSKSIPYEGGYYGIALLSKYPFISTERFLLPMVEEKREQRSLLVGRIELDNGTVVTIASTHLDLKDSIRVVQVREINSILKKENNPIVLAGDFNARPNSCEIQTGMNVWLNTTADTAFTIPAENPTSKIDYIFTYPRDKWKVFDFHVLNQQLSDHCAVISELELLE